MSPQLIQKLPAITLLEGMISRITILCHCIADISA